MFIPQSTNRLLVLHLVWQQPQPVAIICCGQPTTYTTPIQYIMFWGVLENCDHYAGILYVYFVPKVSVVAVHIPVYSDLCIDQDYLVCHHHVFPPVLGKVLFSRRFPNYLCGIILCFWTLNFYLFIYLFFFLRGGGGGELCRSSSSGFCNIWINFCSTWMSLCKVGLCPSPLWFAAAAVSVTLESELAASLFSPTGGWVSTLAEARSSGTLLLGIRDIIIGNRYTSPCPVCAAVKVVVHASLCSLVWYFSMINFLPSTFLPLNFNASSACLILLKT